MLLGAFLGLAATFASGSFALGLASAIAGGVALNALLGVLVINFAVNQVVTGAALDIFALGLTGVAYRRLFGLTGRALTIAPIRPLALGPLVHLPIVGAAIFDQPWLVYFALVLIPLCGWFLKNTRAGLRLRAAGEHPAAAEAMEIPVRRVRWLALIISGALSGLGGAYLTLAYTGAFVPNITGGRGFVALAMVIVGRWNAWGIAAASLLFGAAMALQFTLQATGIGLPYQLFLAIPYALTLLVLATAGGQAQAPSALGEPYTAE